MLEHQRALLAHVALVVLPRLPEHALELSTKFRASFIMNRETTKTLLLTPLPPKV